MKTKFYLAGPWFNENQMKFIHNAEGQAIKAKKDGAKIKVFMPRIDTPPIMQKEGTEAVYKVNKKEVKRANIIVALLEEKDTGTAFELGMAVALNKKIYLVTSSKENFIKSKANLMLAYAGDVITIEQLYDLFTYGPSAVEPLYLDLKEEDIE